MYPSLFIFIFFFFNDTATTEIYTLSLHDALPIYTLPRLEAKNLVSELPAKKVSNFFQLRSEEHTSELQSRPHLVCRLLLEKKKHYTVYIYIHNKDNKSSSVQSF